MNENKYNESKYTELLETENMRLLEALTKCEDQVEALNKNNKRLKKLLEATKEKYAELKKEMEQQTNDINSAYKTIDNVVNELQFVKEDINYSKQSTTLNEILKHALDEKDEQKEDDGDEWEADTDYE